MLQNGMFKNKEFKTKVFKQIVGLLLLVSSCLVVVSCSSHNRPEVADKINHYQIAHVNVVDVVNRVINYDVRVEVVDGKINAIENYRESKGEDNLSTVNKSIKTIDGRGKFLIPGLWDNHSTLMYFAPEVDYPLYIANGVTSIRSNLSCPNEDETSFYACMKDKAAWRSAVNNEELVGPNLQGWGTFPVNGYRRTQHPDLPNFAGGVTVAETKKIVDHYTAYSNATRPSFIKVYNWLPKDSFIALTKYANTQGFEIAGHMPRAVSIQEAVDAGQRSFAHARLFLYDCSDKAGEVRAGKHRKSKLTTFYPWLMANYNEETCQQRFQYMADNNVYLNPTLMTRRNDYYSIAGLHDKMQGLEYAHYLFEGEWQEEIDKHGTELTAQEIKIFKDFYELSAKTIADAQHQGVKILAGSDSWSEFNVPGFSLHEELQALSDAGIDNFSVLRSASINGAEYFGIADHTGSIDVGKNAEMVLLDANPIDDIKNTQQIAMVFKSNQIYDQAQINELKSGVKDIAGSHLFTAKLIMKILENPSGF